TQSQDSPQTQATPETTAQPAAQNPEPATPAIQTLDPNAESQGVPAQDAGQPISSQAPDNDQATFVFKKKIEEVVLHATVVDDGRRLVPYLDRNAFTVYENGVAEKITSFRREDIPVALGVVIDNSGSMRDKRDKVNQAVINLVRVSNPEDEIFVVNFSQNYYL